MQYFLLVFLHIQSPQGELLQVIPNMELISEEECEKRAESIRQIPANVVPRTVECVALSDQNRALLLQSLH